MSGRLTEDSSQRRTETFVSCRIGLELQQFDLDLKRNINEYNIGGSDVDFMITPIVAPGSVYSNDVDQFKVLSDLRLPVLDWETKIAVSISYQPCRSIDDSYTCDKIFRTLFEHALYLPTQAVIIDCPDYLESQKIVADVINEKLKRKVGRPLILFRIHLGRAHDYKSEEIRNFSLPKYVKLSSSGRTAPAQSDDSSNESGYDNGSPPNIEPTDRTERKGKYRLGYHNGIFLDDWSRWNAMRSLLIPDIRVGVCLYLYQDLDFDQQALQRWAGEPVRLITMTCDRFVSQPGCEGSTRLAGRLKEFIRSILLANSFLTALVVVAMPGIDMQPYLRHLSYLCASFDKQHPDTLRAWNDNLMTPLQPLSTNLDASTYQVFELDRAKYINYQEAMTEALDFLLMKPESKLRDKFSLMVLGAGRGPLVDAMIRAIESLKLTKKFKIYALDKNYSSVQALREKRAEHWSKTSANIQTEVVRADMRYWLPEEEADLIATELLGSFSDNELSPECLEGTWRFTTPKTISIPESYTSYIAPICSYRMHQELNIKYLNSDKPYDQIHVVRFSNIYTISDAQPLFTFQHLDLSQEPRKGANQRSARLVFTSPIDIVCHGFAGYFMAKLFGTTTISTVPASKTNSMDSWFPAYIPIEEPIQLAANTELELEFSRLDDDNQVWYEWIVARPVRSRIHSQGGVGSAMSKII